MIFRRKRKKREAPTSEIVGDVADAVILNEIISPGSTAAAIGAVADAAGAVGGAAVEVAGAVAEGVADAAGEVLSGGFDG